MYVRVTQEPTLAPYIPQEGGFMIENAPPPAMRKAWIGLEFHANLESTGFYQEVQDRKAKVIKIRGGKPVYPMKTIYRGVVPSRTMYTLPFKEGIKVLKTNNIPLQIIKWYERRWPEKSGFLFEDDEVMVLEGLTQKL